MEDRKYIIYKITNKINNKIYIGQFAQKTGWSSYMGSGTSLILSQKKYGIKNFTKEIIEYCTDKQHLDQREIYWISYYNSTNKKIGYNITKGGGGVLGCKMSEEHKQKLREINIGKTLTEEHKQKLREKNIGKTLTEEHKQKIREKQLGKKGKKPSEETKQKLREINLGKKHTVEAKQKNSRAIIIDEVEYYSITYASEQLNISQICIYKRIKSKKYQNYNYKENKIDHNKPKKIIIDEIEYNNISEASKQLNIGRSHIRKKLNSPHFPNYKFI